MGSPELIDLDDLVGFGVQVGHCDKPMRLARTSTTWEGVQGSGFELSEGRWVCGCGATMTVNTRVPS